MEQGISSFDKGSFKTLKRFEDMAKSSVNLLSERTDLNPKLERTFNRTEAAKYLRVDERTMEAYAEELGFNGRAQAEEMNLATNSFRLTMNQLFEIRDILPETTMLKKAMRRAKKPVKGKPSIISVQNQKGGVGKTQTSVTLATGLAIEFPAEYQIVVIDMDGQSTLTSYFPSNEKRTTIGDLVLLDPKSDDYQEKVRAAVSDTNYRNLKIIPAAQKDRDIESVFHEGVHAEMISDPYKRLNSVIDAIKYDCDIIIIDTPPSLGYASINSYYAANAVIFPIGATQPDTDATCQYFTYIPDTYRTLMRLGHSGYDFSKILITNFDKSQSSMEVVDEVQFYFNGSYLNTEFVKSEAVRRCSLHKSTVFDYSKSGYKGTKATYESAYKNSKDIVFEVANLIFEQWDLNRD